MKDMLGKSIQEGDIVAFPGRQSSSLWMTVAKVLEVREQDGAKPQALKVLPIQTTRGRWREDEPFSAVVLHKLETVLIVQPNDDRPLTAKERNQVADVIIGQGRIYAIKFIRQDLRTTWGLKEAYDAVNEISNTLQRTADQS